MRTELRPAHRPTVLIVDDDPDILESFTQILEAKGYGVDSAETGREFLEKSGTRVYDVVIVDLKLPDIGGTQLLAHMRKISPTTKKIVITGYPTLESAIDAMGSGTDAYLLKPVEPEEFLRVVEQKIREKQETELLTANEVIRRAKQFDSETRLSEADGASKNRKDGTRS